MSLFKFKYIQLQRFNKHHSCVWRMYSLIHLVDIVPYNIPRTSGAISRTSDFYGNLYSCYVFDNDDDDDDDDDGDDDDDDDDGDDDGDDDDDDDDDDVEGDDDDDDDEEDGDVDDDIIMIILYYVYYPMCTTKLIRKNSWLTNTMYIEKLDIKTNHG